MSRPNALATRVRHFIRSFRHMHLFSSHTFSMMNSANDRAWVKFHFRTQQGIQNLTDAEAEKFWPVYEQYVSELVQINHAKYDLIKQYVQTGGALTDGEAENAASQWANVDRSVADLRMKYIPIFRKVLSSKSTALFYQLDRRVQLMIDLQLASSLPLVQP